MYQLRIPSGFLRVQSDFLRKQLYQLRRPSDFLRQQSACVRIQLSLRAHDCSRCAYDLHARRNGLVRCGNGCHSCGNRCTPAGYSRIRCRYRCGRVVKIVSAGNTVVIPGATGVEGRDAHARAPVQATRHKAPDGPRDGTGVSVPGSRSPSALFVELGTATTIAPTMLPR